MIVHYPAREDNIPVRRYIALCGYVSTNKKEFCNPAKPEKCTCADCRDYDRIQSAEQWTTAIPIEEA